MTAVFLKKYEDFSSEKPPSSNKSNTNGEAAQSANRKSTAFLDGLRGLAALTVFIQHYGGNFSAGEHEFGFGQEGHYTFVSLPFVRILWNGGNASVVIFFVLSGYVLSLGHLHRLHRGKNEDTRRSLLSAAVRRPIRLYLPALMVSAIYAVFLHIPGPLVLPVPWLAPQENLMAEVSIFIKSSFQFFNPFRAHDSELFWYRYNMVMWTIPIELKGSILVFAILAALTWVSAGRDPKRMILPAALLFFTAATMLQLCWLWSMASFLFGTMLAIIDVWKLDDVLLQRIPEELRPAILYSSFFAGWFLLSQPAHAGDISFSSHTPGWAWLTALIPAGYSASKYYRYWQSWGALLLVYPILRLDRLQGLLSVRPLRFLGRVSFMLYLVHLPLFRILGDRLQSLLGGGLAHDSLAGGFWDRTFAVPDIGPVGLSLRFLLCMMVMLPLTMLVSHHTMWIDDTAIKLSKQAATKLGLEGATRANKSAYQGPVLPITRRKSF